LNSHDYILLTFFSWPSRERRGQFPPPYFWRPGGFCFACSANNTNCIWAAKTRERQDLDDLRLQPHLETRSSASVFSITLGAADSRPSSLRPSTSLATSSSCSPLSTALSAAPGPNGPARRHHARVPSASAKRQQQRHDEDGPAEAPRPHSSCRGRRGQCP